MSLLVSLVTIAVVAGQCVHTFMSALVDFHFGAFIHIAVQRLVGFVGTISNLIAHQMIVDALSIRASELAGGAGAILLLRTAHLVRTVAAVIFAVATILRSDAFEILTRELLRCTSLVNRIAMFALVTAITAIVVVIAQPALHKVIHSFIYD